MDAINEQQLARLTGPQVVYQSRDTGDAEMGRMLANNATAPSEVRLKVLSHCVGTVKM